VRRVKGQSKQSVEYPQRNSLNCLAALTASLYFLVNSGHDLFSSAVYSPWAQELKSCFSTALCQNCSSVEIVDKIRN